MKRAKVFVAAPRHHIAATFTLYEEAVGDRSQLLHQRRAAALSAGGRGSGSAPSDSAAAARRGAGDPQAWPADALFLDAYDTAADAGGFYRTCGFRELGRVTYKGTPLIYYEWLVKQP